MGTNSSPPSDVSWIEANFSALLEAVPVAMLIIDDQGRIVLVNSQTNYSPHARRGEILLGCDGR